MTSQNDIHALYLIHLLSCALCGQTPRPLPEGESFEAVFTLACSNSIASTCACAVQLVPNTDEEERKRWQIEEDRNLMRHAVFDMQREAVFAAMDKAELAYLPLKGIVVSREYPRPEMRWMCDNDILFGHVDANGTPQSATESDARKLQKIMEAYGFKTARFKRCHHDSYEKAPFISMEMHRYLVSAKLPCAAYYENPWQRACASSDSANKSDSDSSDGSSANKGSSNDGSNDNTRSMAFAFSHEDSYLFHIAHTHKHFAHAGCGVRCLADEWVLMQAWGPSMDREYLDAELQKLDMVEFEATLRHLAQACIGDDVCGRALAGDTNAIEAADAEMLAYMLNSGTYGTVNNRVKNQMAREANEHGEKFMRARYLLKRAFPGFKHLKQCYPILERAPWLAPGACVFRLITKSFTRSKYVAAELSAVAKEGTSSKTSPDNDVDTI